MFPITLYEPHPPLQTTPRARDDCQRLAVPAIEIAARHGGRGWNRTPLGAVMRSTAKAAAKATAAALVMTLTLGACSETPPEPPAPIVQPAPVAATPAPHGGIDPSVPDAGAVLKPGAAPKVDAAAGRSNSTLTRAQESTAMPLPGQNNDHSAPLTPAKRASASGV